MTEQFHIFSLLGQNPTEIWEKIQFFHFYVVLFFINTSTDISRASSYFTIGHWKWALATFLPVFSPFFVNLFFWSAKIAKNKISERGVTNTGSFSSVLGHLPVYQHYR
jgi:hypothetical protein